MRRFTFKVKFEYQIKIGFVRKFNLTVTFQLPLKSAYAFSWALWGSCYILLPCLTHGSMDRQVRIGPRFSKILILKSAWIYCYSRSSTGVQYYFTISWLFQVTLYFTDLCITVIIYYSQTLFEMCQLPDCTLENST